MGNFSKGQIARFLVSLCISIFLWGYVTNMHDPVQRKTLTNVPVSIENLEVLESQNLAIDAKSPVVVNVVVEGRYSAIQNVSNKDVSVTMDLSDLALKEGSNTILLNVSSLNKDIKIVKEKTSLQTKIDVVKLLQKEIPIIVNAIGDLDANYITGEPLLSKDKVIASGTKEALNDVKYVVATVELNGATNTIKTTSQLKAINKVGNEATNIILKDKEIDLSIPINFVKEVPIELRTKNNVPNGHKLDKFVLDKTSIAIVGQKEVIDKITSIKTEELDLSRRYYDFDKKLNLVFPNGVGSKNNITSVYGSFVVTKK